METQWVEVYHELVKKRKPDTNNGNFLLKEKSPGGQVIVDCGTLEFEEGEQETRHWCSLWNHTSRRYMGVARNLRARANRWF